MCLSLAHSWTAPSAQIDSSQVAQLCRLSLCQGEDGH